MFGGKPITLFHVRGIRIAVDWSWFLVLFLVIFWLSRFYGDVLGESSSGTTPFVLAVISALAFFGSIVLHELGHAFAALRNGIGISSIQLWIFGGMARMDRESPSPAAEFKVAIAGPLVTLAIVVVLTAVGIAAVGAAEFKRAVEIESGSGVSGVMAMVGWLATINLLVLIFNLLPAFPMDGGRIVRAIAWWRTGDRGSATRFAANLGRVFGYVFIGGGLVLIALGDAIGGIWLALIGFLINSSARAASVQTRITGKISSLQVSASSRRWMSTSFATAGPGFPWSMQPTISLASSSVTKLTRCQRLLGPPLTSRTCWSTTTAPSRFATMPRSTRCSRTVPCAASALSWQSMPMAACQE
jgi:Zn-dependent protease